MLLSKSEMKKTKYKFERKVNILVSKASLMSPFVLYSGLFFMTIGGNAKAAELPKSLQEAVLQVQTEDAEEAIGVLRRFAYTDNVDERLAARTALAELDRNAGRLTRASTWVEDYQNPQPENFEWPRIQAYVEAAKIQFMQGNAFESVKRLTDAKAKTTGLAKISSERALSWVVEQKPELKQALEYEKSALKTGESYFKRKKISDTAGLEPAKPGSDIWKRLKPEIEVRIADLERKIRIDSYGLDYVLYSEAQEYRKASHPLAMDFTNVAAAFNQEGEIGGRVPGADYEMAVQRYTEILEFFPNNPYGQAAKLYLAVCTAKTGDPDEAIKQLKAFYKEDPDGLLRGEALKLMGDLYLFANWDKVNSREAYERAIRWIEATETRTRVLDTYLVPEKSIAISKPPEKSKFLSEKEGIKIIDIPSSVLVNRITSKWYLDSLRVESEWRLGYLELIEDDWDKAFARFDTVLKHDKVLRLAQQGKFFNPYDRLKIGRKNGAIVGTSEQTRGLKEKTKMVILWGDMQLMLKNFPQAMNSYRQIQLAAYKKKDSNALMRSVLGEMLVKRELNQIEPVQDITKMHDLVLEYPNSPSAPYLLEICAMTSEGEPLPSSSYYKQIYTNYPNSFFAPRAMYNEILKTIKWEEHDKRRQMINDFKQQFPTKTEYHDALEKLDSRIIEYLNENN